MNAYNERVKAKMIFSDRVKAFIKEQAELNKISIKELMADTCSLHVAKFKRHLYLDLKEKFPELSTPHIGSFFNRKHSGVVLGMKKARKERKNDMDNH